jgi:hypothetical protein
METNGQKVRRETIADVAKILKNTKLNGADLVYHVSFKTGLSIRTAREYMKFAQMSNKDSHNE